MTKYLDKKAVGDRIKNIRLSLGLSMEEFGLKYFETSKGTVNNWEKGRNLPNKKNLKIISQLGDMTVEELLNDSHSVDDNLSQRCLYELDLQNIGFNETKYLTIDGFNAAIKRIGGNHLCGYVEIPKGLEVNINDIDCHGGITFNQENTFYFPMKGRIIGFDCAHAGDWLPCFPIISGTETYKDTGFVLNEIWKIVQQLQKLQEGKR